MGECRLASPREYDVSIFVAAAILPLAVITVATDVRLLEMKHRYSAILRCSACAALPELNDGL